MDQKQQLSALIGEVYDATLDPARWPHALGKARNFVGGVAASLYSKDAARISGSVYYYEGDLEQRYIDLYWDKFVKLDPTTAHQYFADIEEPIGVADLMPYNEFVKTRFFKEWVQPQGLVDCVNVLLDKSGTNIALFGVFRHERDGLTNLEARRRMRLIAPHIRRAVVIANVIELRTTQADTFADTLDGLAAGMFLVDANGRIAHANAAGHAMLEARDIVYAVGGRLLAKNSRADQALRDIFAAAAEGDTAVGTRGISIAINGKEGDTFVAHVLPLTSGARRGAGNTYKAAAALFVHKAAIAAPSPPEIVAKIYGLTPTELRILLAVVEVGGVAEVANALGVTENTVKFHLNNLYTKTGTNRQADLVKLLAGFSNPLLGRLEPQASD